MVARFNDPLDSSLDNSNQDIKDGNLKYLPYGAYFWRNPAYPLNTTIKVT
jgi:hypothetical protein